MKLTTTIIITTILIFSLSLATTRGIDKSFNNQDRMLCNSAKISGNSKYLKKCECFYAGENIECIGEIKEK